MWFIRHVSRLYNRMQPPGGSWVHCHNSKIAGSRGEFVEPQFHVQRKKEYTERWRSKVAIQSPPNPARCCTRRKRRTDRPDPQHQSRMLRSKQSIRHSLRPSKLRSHSSPSPVHSTLVCARWFLAVATNAPAVAFSISKTTADAVALKSSVAEKLVAFLLCCALSC